MTHAIFQEELHMASPTGQSQPNPALIFDTLNAYQRTAALKAAIELDLFTAIGESAKTSAALAKRCQTADRGMRILCDYLVIVGFLTKSGQQYGLTNDSAVFLDRRSPAYMGSVAGFLTMPELMETSKDLAAVVRKGGTLVGNHGTVEPSDPKWVEFARSMAPMMIPAAEAISGIVKADAGEKWKVLDIAAGHGMFGITLAKHNPNAEIFALDWPRVLDVAAENAAKVGLAARYHKIPGSAFDVDFGSGYDLILLTNILHHFDPVMIEMLLRKVRASLTPNGRALTLEFVPNEDRVSPPTPASFALVMLATTPEGDAYTFSEYDKMFRDAGFSGSDAYPLTGMPQTVLVSRK
jgi:2-polyprenyl-3-methyl-5-hydroxy-6-metoxy-1,4-benzoquinol methylase